MSKRKIIKYALVTNRHPPFIVSEVNKLLEEGWELLGPAQMAMGPHGNSNEARYIQTLVLYEPEPANSDIEHFLDCGQQSTLGD